MFGRRTKKSRRARNHPNSHLSFEPLEERHMLTVYTVTQSSDTGSISTPNTLSWAIDQVNTHPGGLQEIRFSILGGGGTVNSFQLDVDGTNPGSYRLNAYTNNFGFNGSVVSTDWSYLTATVSDTTLSLYYNGTLTNNSTLSFSETKTFRDYLIGVNRGGDFFFKGTIDEVRLARNSVKSADWISTSYNNQNAPASFYSVGPEEAVFSGLQDFYLGVIADYQQAVPELNENNNTKVQSTPLIIN